MNIQIRNRDGDGYLEDMSEWTPEIGCAMAQADGMEISDEQSEQVMKARKYYENQGCSCGS